MRREIPDAFRDADRTELAVDSYMAAVPFAGFLVSLIVGVTLTKFDHGRNEGIRLIVLTVLFHVIYVVALTGLILLR